MTTISSLNTAKTLELASLTNAANVNEEANAVSLQTALLASQSSIVTIPSAAGAINLQVYNADGTLAIAAPSTTATWATDSTDAVTLRMKSDYTASTFAGQFSDLGSVLLDRFKSTGSDFTQSVTTGTGLSGPSAKVDLTVKTASGITVDIELDSTANGLSVSIKSNGNLSDKERDALSQLAGGFQQAIDGLSGQPPQLNLSGLTGFDTSVLSSVNFTYNITGDDDKNISASYSQDSASRSLSVTDSSGTVNVKVDTSNPALWGTSQQRAESVASLLKQFEAANARGHGNQDLMSMFEDGFAEMNSVYGTPTPQSLPGAENTTWMQQSDQAMLTGLGDYSASITDAKIKPNPLRQDEADTFDYSVSQDTQLDGTALNGTITQHQHSQLDATYHEALDGSGPPKLTTDLSTQGYDYIRINDTADSTVKIVTAKGVLVAATLNQSSDQRTRDMKYERGQLVSDVTTPVEKSSSQDLLALLQPLISNNDAKHDTTDWQQELAQIHGMIQLKAY